MSKEMDTVCGLYCDECRYLGSKCEGCDATDGGPLWVEYMDYDICPVYECCTEDKELEHCGLCDGFPCDTFMKMEEGDPEMSPVEAAASAEKRMNELIRRAAEAH
jgi:hypothetical protein